MPPVILPPQLTTLLLSLDGPQLEEVIKRCRAVLAVAGAVITKPNEPAQESREHEWVLNGIRHVLKEKGLAYKIPMTTLQRMREYDNFTEAEAEIGPWLLTLIPQATRTEKLALSHLAAKCLARHVAKFAPVSWSTMLSFYLRVPTAIEESFPGYAQQGWIRFILDRAVVSTLPE